MPTSTDAEYLPLYAGKFGKGVHVKILTKKLGNNHGSPPPRSSSGSVEWQFLVQRRNMENRSFYVQGHLLNEELGGPGESKNLTPITQSANSEHLHAIEKKVKAAVSEGKVVSYTVWAEYGRTANNKLINMVNSALQHLSQGNISDEKRNEIELLKLVKGILENEKYIPKDLIFSASELEESNGDWKEKSKIGQDGISVDIDNDGVNNIEELKELYL